MRTKGETFDAVAVVTGTFVIAGLFLYKVWPAADHCGRIFYSILVVIGIAAITGRMVVRDKDPGYTDGPH